MKAYTEPKRPEVWRDIPEFVGRYQASSWGRIRKLGHGARIMSQSQREIRGTYRSKLMVCYLTTPGMKRIMRSVSRLVASAFGMDIEGKVVVHVNRLHEDCSVRNLKVVSRTTCARHYTRAVNRKPVLKIDKSGEVVDVYGSARAAAKANGCSSSTIGARCNGQMKSRYAPDGYEYRWEEDWSWKACRSDR